VKDRDGVVRDYQVLAPVSYHFFVLRHGLSDYLGMSTARIWEVQGKKLVQLLLVTSDGVWRRKERVSILLVVSDGRLQSLRCYASGNEPQLEARVHRA
jgi:hypothetical protein